MNNLLVFYGELRCFETIIQLYEKYGWLDNYDVFVSAWDTSEGKDVEIEDIMKRYEKINFLFKVTNPYYGNLQRHENCIIYHCKSVFDEIDVNQYDNVILQRTDVECRLDMIDFNLITDSVVYRWFDNLQGETTKDGIYNKDGSSKLKTWMNDLIMVGKAKILKEFFQSESKGLPNYTKCVNEMNLKNSGLQLRPPNESLGGIKCLDIASNILKDRMKRLYYKWGKNAFLILHRSEYMWKQYEMSAKYSDYFNYIIKEREKLDIIKR